MDASTPSGEVGATGSSSAGDGHPPRPSNSMDARLPEQDTPEPSADPAPISQAKPDRPPRPMNAWLLFRTAQVKNFQNQNPAERRAQGQLSKVIAEMWRAASVETKKEYEDLAREKKEEHARLYPDYRYTPRDKPAKIKRRKPATVPSTSGPRPDVTLPNPSFSSTSPKRIPPRPASSASASSSRSQVPPQVGYHPYGARGAAYSPLPRIDTSHTTNTWQPGPPLSAAVEYSGSTWQPYGALTPDDGLQPYRGPISAPAEFPTASSSELQRHGHRADAPLYNGEQYSPSWPSAPLNQSLVGYPTSATSEHSRDPSFPGSTNSLPTPPDPVPTIDYSFYRAPASTYHTPASNTSSLPYRSTSSLSSSSLHQQSMYDYTFHDDSSPNLTGESAQTHPPTISTQEYRQQQIHDVIQQYEQPPRVQERGEWPSYHASEQARPSPYSSNDPVRSHSQLQLQQQRHLHPHRQSFYAQAQSAGPIPNPHSSTTAGTDYPPPPLPPPPPPSSYRE